MLKVNNTRDVRVFVNEYSEYFGIEDVFINHEAILFGGKPVGLFAHMESDSINVKVPISNYNLSNEEGRCCVHLTTSKSWEKKLRTLFDID